MSIKWMRFYPSRKRRYWKSEMVHRNFLVKVTDAKQTDIQKALQTAGITVRSIIEIFHEGDESPETEEREK